MKERVVIIFIAVTLGLLATTIGFFLYESSKPNKEITSSSAITPKKPAPEPKNDISLTITSPKNETVTQNRTIQVKGSTDPENIIIISTNQEDIAISPTSNGSFSASISIDSGENKLIITAIDTHGNSKKITQTVSFSSDEF